MHVCRYLSVYCYCWCVLPTSHALCFTLDTWVQSTYTVLLSYGCYIFTIVIVFIPVSGYISVVLLIQRTHSLILIPAPSHWFQLPQSWVLFCYSVTRFCALLIGSLFTVTVNVSAWHCHTPVLRNTPSHAVLRCSSVQCRAVCALALLWLARCLRLVNSIHWYVP